MFDQNFYFRKLSFQIRNPLAELRAIPDHAEDLPEKQDYNRHPLRRDFDLRSRLERVKIWLASRSCSITIGVAWASHREMIIAGNVAGGNTVYVYYLAPTILWKTC